MPRIISRRRLRELEAASAESLRRQAELTKRAVEHDLEVGQLGRLVADRDEQIAGLASQLRHVNAMWGQALRDLHRYRMAWQSARARAAQFLPYRNVPRRIIVGFDGADLTPTSISVVSLVKRGAA